MKQWLVLAPASVAVVWNVHAGIYADGVVQYSTGTGYQDGYVDPQAALGQPSRVTDDPLWGASNVDPFGPPYLASQVVSIGAGGSLTLQFNTPIANNPANPYGLDFLLFGNAGFTVKDYNDPVWKTDGGLFGSDNATARISVSRDGTTYYTLSPSLCPVLDGLYPTDGLGDFQQPVNPALRAADFEGKDMAGIRALYAGSAGGAGFDLAWARDGNGQAVNLPEVSYVKIEVLSQKAEIDGVVAVPEPATWALLLGGLSGLALRRRHIG